MLRKFFVATTATMLGLFSTAQIASVATDTVAAPAPEAEEPKPSLTITGSADAYYKYDFSKTKANTFTSFTGTHNNFSLGMASVKLEHKGNKVGAVLDLGFGPRAKFFNGSFFYFTVMMDKQCSLDIFFIMLCFIKTKFFFEFRNTHRDDEVYQFEYAIRHGKTIADNNSHSF